MADELFVNVLGGSRICVPATLDNITTFVLLEQETWFEDELGFVRACLESGQVAADVGANLGVFTTVLARSVGAEGKVFAFEPTASTASLLRRTLDEGGLAQVQLVQAALSDRRGTALLEIGDSPELNVLAETPAAGRATERVELLTLDDVARENGVDEMAFLKIDAEGHEPRIARGAQQVLKRCEPLVMFEITHGDAVQYGLLDYLETLGFSAYRLIPGLGVLRAFSRAEPLDPFQLNLFACTPGRARLLQEAGFLLGEGAEPTRATTAGGDAYAQALACFERLQTDALEPADEVALLMEAGELARAALGEKESAARALTVVRLCVDLGHRGSAVEILGRLAGSLDTLSLDEPCLPPSSRYAALDPQADPEQWLQCAVLENMVRLSAFSSVFQEPKVLGVLEFLKTRAYYCAEMERRRQLLRMRSGLQERPEPHALLVREAPDNLNPSFWSGTGQ